MYDHPLQIVHQEIEPCRYAADSLSGGGELEHGAGPMIVPLHAVLPCVQAVPGLLRMQLLAINRSTAVAMNVCKPTTQYALTVPNKEWAAPNQRGEMSQIIQAPTKNTPCGALVFEGEGEITHLAQCQRCQWLTDQREALKMAPAATLAPLGGHRPGQPAQLPSTGH